MVSLSHNALSECQLCERCVFFHSVSYVPLSKCVECIVAQVSSKIMKCRVCQVHGGKSLVRMAKLAMVKRLKGGVRFRTRRHRQLDKGCRIEVINRKCLLIPPLNYEVGGRILCTCDVWANMR